MKHKPKKIFVSTAGVVAGPFSLESALAYMRSLEQSSVAMDADLVIYAINPGPNHKIDIEHLDGRNTSIIDRVRLEAIAQA